MEELTRSFICLDFPDEVIKEITRIQELLGKKQFTGKLIEPENLHLTLKFLGELTQENLEKAKSLLSKIKFSELNLKISEAGTFTHKGQPRIVWIKISGNVFSLQEKIDSCLTDIFQKEERFMSHLTIARIKYVKSPKDFTDYIKNIKPKPIKFNIDKFSLKSSELKPQGPVYKILEDYFAEQK